MAWIKRRGDILYLFDKEKVAVIDKATGQQVVDEKGRPKFKYRKVFQSLKVKEMDRETQKKVIRNYEEEKSLKKKGLVVEKKEWHSFVERYLRSVKTEGKARLTAIKEAIVLSHYARIVNPVIVSENREEQAELYASTRLSEKKSRKGKRRKCEDLVKPSTVRAECRYLSTIFQKAIKWGYTSINPFYKFKVVDPTAKKVLRKCMDKSTVQEFFGRMLEKHGALWHLMASIYFYEGFRTHEIVSMRKEHVLYKKGKIFVLGKGGKEAEIDIHPEVLSLLRQFVKPGETGYLFVDENGRQIVERTIQKRFKKIYKDMGLDWAVPHTLRHSIVSNLLEAGVPIQDARDHARHANIATTNTYAHAVGGPSIGRMRLNGPAEPTPI